MDLSVIKKEVTGIDLLEGVEKKTEVFGNTVKGEDYAKPVRIFIKLEEMKVERMSDSEDENANYVDENGTVPEDVSNSKNSGAANAEDMHGIIIHAAQKHFTCEKCTRYFSTSSNLARHNTLLHGDQVEDETWHHCELCPKTFRKKWYLTRHLRIHSGETPYQCGKCWKSFASASNLAEHRYIHSEQRPFECETCLGKFKSSQSLTKHQRIHSTDQRCRPLTKCDVCDVTFDNVFLLTKMHIRPFTCDVCRNTFSRYCLMIRHECLPTRTLTTRPAALKCKVCEERFKSFSELSNHPCSPHW